MSWKKEKPNKKENMAEYAKYLEYRKDHKGKLSYDEFKRNHKHRYNLWKKRQWSIYYAKHFIETQKMAKKKFNQKHPITWKVYGGEKLYKEFNK